LGVGSIALQVVFTYITRDIMNALTRKDSAAFYERIFFFVGWLIVMVPIFAYQPWLEKRIGIQWRSWLTQWLLERWLARRVYYRLQSHGLLDNPDQRVSEDAALFTSSTVSYAIRALLSALRALIFFYILWSLSSSLAIVLTGYAVGATYLSAIVGRRLIVLNFDQQHHEADFRFGMVQVRNHAEAIAMYGGERSELGRLARVFARVRDNYVKLIRWQRHLALLTNFYAFSLAFLPYILLAGRYFSGGLAFGELSQAAMAFDTLQRALAFLLEEFQGITSYASAVNRLSALVESYDEEVRAEPGAQILIEDGAQAEFKDVALCTPDARPLVTGLSLPAAVCESLLLKGPSGTGKSSLFRALAGLQRTGNGTVVKPRSVLFLAQRPYLTAGSLREQLLYPGGTEAGDSLLERALRDAELDDLLGRVGALDSEAPWSELLSAGEQQRLACARLFVHRPAYAVLDEATNALDPEMEQRIYRRLQVTGVRLISAGHRDGLSKFHKHVLDTAVEGWPTSESHAYVGLDGPPRPGS
jgi:putative ATP-binding cassette transporter